MSLGPIARTCDDIMDWLCDRISVMAVVVFVVIGLLIAVFVTAAISSARSETFTLKKDEWVCTVGHQESSTFYTKVGSVMVPSTSHYDVCDNYQRKSER